MSGLSTIFSAHDAGVDTFLHLLFGLLFAPVVLVVAHTMRPSYAVFALLAFLVPLVASAPGTMPRSSLLLRAGRRVGEEVALWRAAVPLPGTAGSTSAHDEGAAGPVYNG